MLDHHLDHSDAVFLGRAAALPQALSRGPQKTGRAAKLIRQLLQEPVEPFLTDGCPLPVSFGRRICTRCDGLELMRLCAAALPGQLSRRVSRRDGLDLLAEPIHVDIHHGVVGFIRRAAKSVGHEDDAEAPVDRAQHCGEHADVGFAAGDDDGVDTGAAQLLVQVAAGPGGIDMLVEGAGRGNELSRGPEPARSFPGPADRWSWSPSAHSSAATSPRPDRAFGPG